MTSDFSIVFDVDGTLVNIKESYSQTVSLTSFLYCKIILGIKNLPTFDKWIVNPFLLDLKKLSGFNSDYLCTTAIIDFFFEFN